jgi:PAS domain S-box-containing protein
MAGLYKLYKKFLPVSGHFPKQGHEALSPPDEGQDVTISAIIYKLLTEQSDDVIWTMNAQFQTIYMSTSVYKQLGYTVEEYLSMSLEERLPAQSVAIIKSLFNSILQDIKTKNLPTTYHFGKLELEHKHKNGTIIWGELLYILLFDTNHQFAGIHGITRNIDERKRAEAYLKYRLESEELIAGISSKFINLSVEIVDSEIQSTLKSLALFIDARKGSLYIYDSAKNIFHLTHKWERDAQDTANIELNPLPDTIEYLSTFQCTMIGQQKELIRFPAAKLFMEKNIFTPFVVVSLKFKGQFYGLLVFFGEPNVEKTWSIETSRMIEVAGNIFVSTLERKRSNEIENLNNIRNRMFIEHAVDGILIGNIDGTLTDINSEGTRLTGYTKQEILTMRVEDLFPKEDLKLSPFRYDQLLKGGIVLIERNLQRKDQSIIPVEMNTKLMPDGSFQSFIHDITKRRQTEKELQLAKDRAEESDRLKTAFLANMSHEIRTPLNGILGFSQLLEDNTLSLYKKNEYLRIIRSNGDQLLNIINDIIDVAKIEANQLIVRDTPCNLNLLFQDLYSFFGALIAKNNLSIQIQVADIPAALQGKALLLDEFRLRQILVNLLSNSMKFTHEGLVQFGCLLKDSMIYFFVKDTGIGLNPEQQKIIFERFRQADDSTTRQFGGTGLGLTISKSLINLMKGEIWVESDPGKGSTFYFSLPLKISEVFVPSEKTKTKEQTISIDLSGKKILIAEDDKVSFYFLEAVLKKVNGKVIGARNGLEAVELCKKNKDIDLILMDIQLPLLNGYDAASEIRKFNPSVYIIAQTANALSDDKEKCLAAGCNDYVAKPVLKETLFAAIERALKP